MALPDPKNLDLGYLKTGAFCYEASKSSVNTSALDFGYLKSGPFVAYTPVSASTARSFGVIIG